MSEVMPVFFSNLLFQIPGLIAYIAALILALVFWTKYPRPSLLTLLAALIELCVTIVRSYLWAVLPVMARSHGWSQAKLGQVNGVIAVVNGTLLAAGFGLLIWAIYTGRSQK